MANEIPTNDGMNIETLKIDIDVSAKKSNDNVDALEKSLSRLEKRLEELKKVTKSTESTLNGFSSGKNASRVEKSANEMLKPISAMSDKEFRKRYADAIRKTTSRTSYSQKIGGKTTEYYTKKDENGLWTRIYKIVDNELSETVTKNLTKEQYERIAKKNQKEKERLEREAKKTVGLGSWDDKEKNRFGDVASKAKLLSERKDWKGVYQTYQAITDDEVINYKVVNGYVTEIEKKFNQLISGKNSTLGSWGKDNFSEAAKNAKLVSDSTNAAGKHIKKYSEELDDIINTYTVIDGQVTKIDSKIKKSEKSSKRMDTLWKSIGHVLKYRLISSAFNLISKGLTEGVEKAALFDDRINDSISNIIGSSKQLINQIGAAGGELIVSFEPVIVRLIEWLTIGADKVTQFFAALNGKDTYDKAVTQAYDFAKSIRGAYGGIGIDELNIFGSGADGGLLSDVQYVEESLDGWAQGISEFRKEMQPTVDWVNKNLDAVLATAISIGTTIAAIKFANSFKDALNKDLATSLVTGSKDLLGNLQTIAAIGTITLGISFLADENSENDGFGALLTAIGSFLGLNKIGQSLGLTKAGAIGWAIPISLILTVGATIATNDYGAYIDLEEQSKALQEKGMSESAADFLSFIGGHIVGAIKGVPVKDFSEQMAGLPVGLPSTDTLSRYYPNQVSGSTDVPYYSFADVINSSRSAEEQNSEKQDEMIYYLAQIASKNQNIILADDDIGRAYERYIGVKGATMNGGAYANAD